MATVVFSSQQQRLVDGKETVEIEAARVADLISALEVQFPGLDGLLDGLAIAIDGDIHQNARFMPLAPDAEVHFIGAIAGGSDAAVDADRPATRPPLETAWAWSQAGRSVAIATVLETWGSSPCPAGSLLVIADSGEFEGSVSGGCVEGAVVEAACAMLPDGEAQTLDFEVADASAWDVGLACGGRVVIRIETVA